ncbi:MAG: hypothetical protein ACOYXT_04790 [Bacteroidota bacterium]
MKKEIYAVFTVLSLAISQSPTLAQQAKSIPQYWVVESNIHQPRNAIVKFYDANHQLVQEVKMKGIKVDITKRRYQKILNGMMRDVQLPNTMVRTTKKHKSKSSI